MPHEKNFKIFPTNYCNSEIQKKKKTVIRDK